MTAQVETKGTAAGEALAVRGYERHSFQSTQPAHFGNSVSQRQGFRCCCGGG
jgi:hypothetical protein